MTKLGKIVLFQSWTLNMKNQQLTPDYKFFDGDSDKSLESLGKEKCLEALSKMLLIRNFEMRGEQAYQQGKAWGFYHDYSGQEAIQTSAIYALGGNKNLWVGTYRCHALALLLGMTPKEGMCELYGKDNGVARGRGGSMHFYSERMYGGNGIVGGQWPIGAGLAFSLKYRDLKDEIAVCFGGDGSIMQGTFAESMNLCALWDLPLLVVIENNQYSMGTAMNRGVANLPIGENVSKAYGIQSYTVDGMDFAKCLNVFEEAKAYILETGKPVILEAVTYRFKGHSVSDAAPYRSKEEVEEHKKQDPIHILAEKLKEKNWMIDQDLEEMTKQRKEEMIEAMKFAEESSFPDVSLLEEGVFKGEETSRVEADNG